MKFFELIKSWGIKEAFPAYGIVWIGVAVIILADKEHWGLAIIKALTSPDFLATSFAFLFTVMYSFPSHKSHKGTCLWGLIFCVVFFVCAKLAPVPIGNDWDQFVKNANFVRIISYILISIGAVIWTFVVVYTVKVEDVKVEDVKVSNSKKVVNND